jgi:hypothetical protein
MDAMLHRSGIFLRQSENFINFESSFCAIANHFHPQFVDCGIWKFWNFTVVGLFQLTTTTTTTP